MRCTNDEYELLIYIMKSLYHTYIIDSTHTLIESSLGAFLDSVTPSFHSGF